MIILFGDPVLQFPVIVAILANVIYWMRWALLNRRRWGLAVPPLLWWFNVLAYNIAGILFRYTSYQLSLPALITWNTILIWQAGILITGVGVLLFRSRYSTT